MPGTCVIGLQWGDEAKGKLVDLLTSEFDIVVRYQGGANAGHTVVVGDEVYKLHHIPSGILSRNVQNIIAPGVVMNPPTILQEIDGLAGRGIDVKQNLMISDRVHVVLPWHIAEDRAINADTTSGESIGTTLRGIGPCYRDKVGRTYAVRLGDMYRDDFREKIDSIVAAKNRLLERLEGEPILDATAIYDEFRAYADRLEPMVADTTDYLLDAVDEEKKILFEGAQGALLDIDHGTFPFVTSSNSSGVGVCAGSGLPARCVNKVLGVAKAYTTRVGGGPFPTELSDATGQRIRDLGNEYGTTTGRPRRCGWFDSVAVRYTARLSGVTSLSIMMMDVLSQLPEIKICTAYELNGEQVHRFPSHSDDLRRVKPVFETIVGWEKDVTGVRKLADLPDGARRYLDRVAELVGRPVGVVSVGPDRAKRCLLKISERTNMSIDSANLPDSPTFQGPVGRLPRHIAIIMDGNGRWAQRQNLPRIEGHRRGVASVRATVEECARLHIEQLTLYCLSSENWKRPQNELNFLMHLLEQYMIEERSTIMQQNIIVDIIGRRDGIPENVRREMDKTIEMSSRNTGTRLCLAINYGGRGELVDAVRRIAEQARDGGISPAEITEETISAHLYTAGMPDPDLLIRTAGEMRVSNFLLWQISYAELWVTDLCWPEFREPVLHQALSEFANRDRRFGGLNQ